LGQVEALQAALIVRLALGFEIWVFEIFIAPPIEFGSVTGPFKQ
jgi:hypothetical protein